MAWIDALFRRMVQTGCSDLHMTSTLVPMFRLDGEMVPIDGCPAITPDQLQNILFEIAPEENRREFQKTNDTDFARTLVSANTHSPVRPSGNPLSSSNSRSST